MKQQDMAQETVGHARFSEYGREQCGDGHAKVVQNLPVASALVRGSKLLFFTASKKCRWMCLKIWYPQEWQL